MKESIEIICLEEDPILSLEEICHICNTDTGWVTELVMEGILAPLGEGQKSWRFSGCCLRRAQIALRLQHDFEVNLAGAALAVELIEEIEALRTKLGPLDKI